MLRRWRACLQNPDAVGDSGAAQVDGAVKAPRPQQGIVQQVLAVGRAYHQDLPAQQLVSVATGAHHAWSCLCQSLGCPTQACTLKVTCRHQHEPKFHSNALQFLCVLHPHHTSSQLFPTCNNSRQPASMCMHFLTTLSSATPDRRLKCYQTFAILT